MVISLMEGSAKHSQELYSEFQSLRHGLLFSLTNGESSLKSVPDKKVLQQVQEGLSKLRRYLTDATLYLPAYDLRTCEKQLSEIEKLVEDQRSANEPKAKFAFKRVATVPAKSLELSEVYALQREPRTARNEVLSSEKSITSRMNEYVILPSTDACPSGLTISNIDGCIVNLLESAPSAADTRENPGCKATAKVARPTMRAIHVRDAKDSILLLGPVSGSVLLHNLERCTVITSCHQLRLHTSRKIHFHLFASSNPVIEQCSDVGITGYPAQYPIPEDSTNCNKKSLHAVVLDFSHIKDTPSPNWTLLADRTAAESSCLSQLLLADFQPGKQSNQKEFQSLLHDLLPQ